MGRTTTTTARKPRVSTTMKATTRAKWDHYSTISLGCFIPMAALACSQFGGRLLAQGHYMHGGLFLTLCCVLLAVSLPHLRDAITELTHDCRRAGMTLALALDASIVVSELTHAAGIDLGTGCNVAMGLYLVAVTGWSMLLNCRAFLLHQRTAKASRKAR